MSKDGGSALWVRKLKEEMKTQGFGYRKLAERVREEAPGGRTPPGGSEANIRAYQAGRVRHPRAEVVNLISQILGVRPEWLMHDQGPKTPQEEQISQLESQIASGSLPRAEAERVRGFIGDIGRDMGVSPDSLKMLEDGAVVFFDRETGEPVVPAIWDAEAVSPLFFVAWRRLVQLRSPALSPEEVAAVGGRPSCARGGI